MRSFGIARDGGQCGGTPGTAAPRRASPRGSATAPRRRRSPHARSWRAQTLAALAAFALLAALTPIAGMAAAGWSSGAVCAAGTWAAYTAAQRRDGRSSAGPADIVTLVRAALIAGVAALVAESLVASVPVPGGILVPLAAVALALDAVDGVVARRTGTASALGARFDMEADALLILVLSVHVAASGLGWWVVAIGVMRYLFAAAGRVLPRLRGRLPPSNARRFVAAFQGIALTAAASMLLPSLAATALVAVALALLGWSFGRDTVRLLRHGGAEGPAPRDAGAARTG